MARQLAITKKTYLDGFDGWDKDCYVEWRPVTYGDSLALKQLEVSEDETKAFQAIFDMTKSHIVSGKVKVLGEDGQPTLADYESEDLANMPPEMVNRIFADITGAQFDDPKGSDKAQEESNEPTTSESTTEASSSED